MSLQLTVQRRFRCRRIRQALDIYPRLRADALPQITDMMEEIALRRKRRSAAVRSIGRRRICSIGSGARDWVEQRKQQQAREKSADMGLPGDAGAICANCDRADAEDDVDAEPDKD